MTGRAYSSSNVWAQNITAIIQRTEANIASIRDDPAAAAHFASPPAPQPRTYRHGPDVPYPGGRWAEPVYHAPAHSYTPTLKPAHHAPCPECAHPLTDYAPATPQHNRSFYTL